MTYLTVAGYVNNNLKDSFYNDVMWIMNMVIS